MRDIISILDINRAFMTRIISNSFAGILQELELERPLLVTRDVLSDLKINIMWHLLLKWSQPD